MKTQLIEIAIIIAVLVTVIFLFFLYSLCYTSGRESEREEKLQLMAWRKGLTRLDLINYDGCRWVVESIKDGVVQIRNNNEEKFILLTDCWPVE